MRPGWKTSGCPPIAANSAEPGRKKQAFHFQDKTRQDCAHYPPLGVLLVEAAAAATATVTKSRGEPRANMTTYYVPLTSSGKPLVAMVEVFDVALADGALVPLVGHDVRLASASLPSRREQAAYELVLEFAPFNGSLYYDPSLGLGVLLGRSDASGGGNGDDDNLALVVATSVIIPLAFVLVVGAVVVGVAVLWWRKRRANAHLQHQIDQMRDNSAL